jgi:hypothetical protein
VTFHGDLFAGTTFARSARWGRAVTRPSVGRVLAVSATALAALLAAYCAAAVAELARLDEVADPTRAIRRPVARRG